MKEMKTDTLWDHLHWLTVLAEQGSFTRAAERLDVSKAAMSQKIKELEEMAGVLLVQRTTRSVRLTSAGEKLVEELREPFARIEQSFQRAGYRRAGAWPGAHYRTGGVCPSATGADYR